ncbi:MAG TPA: SUMF1/EgtB/PvdO family nonheme iron enzyme [Bacteroidia bacterium]|nr:SUMF1/EgtB/PvdO family nonheme iron enzyme [Bacteroidia bacterium]
MLNFIVEIFNIAKEKRNFVMKKLTYMLIAATLILSGCAGNMEGELVGVQGRRPWFHPQPYGTVYVPTGTFHAGQADMDVFFTHTAPNKQITITAFYMDDTEITNNEYRQFVEYVIDSIARYELGDPYVIDNENGDGQIMNRDEFIDWSDPEVTDLLEDKLMVPEGERYYGQKGVDSRKLWYYYEWIDLRAAAHAQPDANRAQFIRKESLRIYPDTLVWVRDFTYAFNEPMTQMYYWHPKYDDYPVVGINWHQAKAFSHWRTGLLNDYYASVAEEPIVTPFRLPTEYEWEYAARGGRDGSMYPWGGPYTRNSKGCFLANFKPGRGDYQADGGVYPVRGYSYFPNDYGLYGMAGNVAEWTVSAYADESHIVVHDENADLQYDAKKDDPPSLKRKVTRGGGWNSVSFYIQNGSRAYEFQDTAKSYIGFRCVMSYIGRSNRDRE